MHLDAGRYRTSIIIAHSIRDVVPDTNPKRFIAPQAHGAVSIALQTFQEECFTSSVRDVASRLGVSQRRFIQSFAAEVGLTPKLYCRVKRFEWARELVRNATAPDWAAVAAACGYFDQSHMIRDFVAFSGLSPVAFLVQQSNHALPDHVLQVGQIFSNTTASPIGRMIDGFPTGV